MDRGGFTRHLWAFAAMKTLERDRGWLICGKNRPLASFTLVEMMVATSVLSLMMIILLQIFNEATRAWAASERKIDAYREARAALYFVSRDLHSSLITTNAPLIINSNYITTGTKPDYLDDSVFFIAALPSNAQEGTDLSDLCAVGYYAAYGGDQSQIGVTNSFKVRRYFRGSNSTYSNFLSFIGNPSFNPELLYSAPSIALGGDEVLARNIANLKFSWQTNKTQPFAVTPLVLRQRPEFLQIRISLDALNYDTAKKLANKSDWNAKTNAALFRANVQTFNTKVSLGGGL
jgi:type II secretory pathway pseudopilin PulG